MEGREGAVEGRGGGAIERERESLKRKGKHAGVAQVRGLSLHTTTCTTFVLVTDR